MSRYHIIELDLENGSKYSVELRTLCHIDAKSCLVFPAVCPRCCVPGTSFNLFVTYAEGKAGLWSALCHGCGKVHIPEQAGPSADVRDMIEERLQHEAATKASQVSDKQETKARKAAIASVEQLMKKEAKVMKAAEKKAKAEKKAETAAKQARKRDTAHLKHLQKVREDAEKVKARKKCSSKTAPAAKNRCIEVMIWVTPDASPLTETADITDASRVKVLDIPEVARHLDKGSSEYWYLRDARWTFIQASAQIEGAPGLLVRNLIVKRCPAFGFHLHILQDGAASTVKGRKEGLKAAQKVRLEITARPALAAEVHVVFWLEDDARADVFRGALDAKRMLTLTSIPGLRAALEDDGTDRIEVWNVRTTDWDEYGVGDAIPVEYHDTVLIRKPDVEGLEFFGVEVECLGKRAPAAPSLSDLANASRALQQRVLQQCASSDVTAALSGAPTGALNMMF